MQKRSEFLIGFREGNACGRAAAGKGRAICFLALMFFLGASVCVGAAQRSLRAQIEQFQADRESLRHVYGVEGAEETTARTRRFLQSWMERLKAAPFDRLGPDGKVDWLLFRNELEGELDALEERERKLAEIDRLIPGQREIAELEQRRRLKKWIEPQAAANLLDRLARELESARERLNARLKKAKPAEIASPVAANRAARRIDQLRRYLRSWFRFRDGYDPMFSWWVRAPYRELDAQLEKQARFLRERLAGFREGAEPPVIGDPIGREALVRALRREWIAYTPEELVRIGEKEMAWCEAQMRKAAAEMGCKDWREALRRVKEDHAAPGKQPELIRKLAEEATEFVESRKLVTVPPLAKESWRIEMMSPEQQKVNPYFTGGRTISVSFPTEQMAHRDKEMSLRGNNVHFCRATVFHELIPGHHLQGFMAQRYRPYRRLFQTPFYVEGWALHWEMRFWDLGFQKSPEDRMGALFWRTHRCARIIFSLKYHLGRMSEQEAIDFLVSHVGHEPRNARAEVRRSVEGLYPPLYQAAYMLGGLQLRALHKELVQSGRMSERAFHDATLQQNAIPIELIRARLEGLPLTPETKPSWRFYPLD